MLLGYFGTVLIAVQRIALFGENVHILYVAEMAQDSGLLLYLLTSEKPKFSSIPFLMCTSREIQLFARSLGSRWDPAYERTP
jgi:hypothetical protein